MTFMGKTSMEVGNTEQRRRVLSADCRRPDEHHGSFEQQGWGERQSEVKGEPEGRRTRTAAFTPALLRACSGQPLPTQTDVQRQVHRHAGDDGAQHHLAMPLAGEEIGSPGHGGKHAGVQRSADELPLRHHHLG